MEGHCLLLYSPILLTNSTSATRQTTETSVISVVLSQNKAHLLKTTHHVLFYRTTFSIPINQNNILPTCSTLLTPFLFLQMSMYGDLSDILREQDRQEHLWYQEYFTADI